MQPLVTRLRDTLAKLLATRRQIAVYGDVMVDEYLHGRQVGDVFRVEYRDWRPGGAANVAMILTRLGADVALFGAVGLDPPGHYLTHLPCELGSRLSVCGDRQTTRKIRRVISNTILPGRVDIESTEDVGRFTAFHTPDEIRDSCMREPAAVAIVDHGKGYCTAERLGMIKNHYFSGTRMIVDVFPGHDYPEQAILKGNRSEQDRHVKPLHIVTDGPVGILWRNAVTGVTSLTRPQRRVAVRDTTGAGDTVTAIWALAMANDVGAMDACDMANLVAGIQCERLGVNTIAPRAIEAAINELEEAQA